MQPMRKDRPDETLLEGVTIENVQERLRSIGVKPNQRIVVKVVNPWNELFGVIERVSERAESLGLTEEEIDDLLKKK